MRMLGEMGPAAPGARRHIGQLVAEDVPTAALEVSAAHLRYFWHPDTYDDYY
jgi:hypothetical protein